MEAAEPIICETPKPAIEKEKIDFTEEINIKKEKDEYKIKFGVKRDDLIIKAFFENSKDIFYYQKTFTIRELQNLSKIFALYESIKEIIDFFKDLNFDFEEKDNDLILKFNAFMPNGKSQLIEMKLERILLDSNQMINYLHEKIRSIEKSIKNSEECAKEEKNKYESEIKELKDNLDKSKDEITKFKEIIVNFNKELSSLKEENKKIIREINLLRKNKFSVMSNNIQDESNEPVVKLTSITSKIIVSINTINFIIDYIKQNDKTFLFKEIKLLFQGSRDGDRTKTCHELCDNKKNVLIIMKSDFGYIYGGYSKIGFKMNKNINDWEYKIDNNSFLFSINLKKIYPVIKDKEVIANKGEDFGLCFDKSLSFHDKFMEKDFNKIEKKIKKMFNGIENNFEMNGGKDTFICKELEVFQLL